MAYPTNPIDLSIAWATFLAQSVDDGSWSDVVVTEKIDEPGKDAAATQIEIAAGQIWSNLIDSFVETVYKKLWTSNKVWNVADAAARDALGSDDDLEAKDLAVVAGDLYYCASVDGPAASTWASLGGGGGGEDWAATLALGRVTGGTSPLIDDGDEIEFDASVPLPFSYGSTSLLQRRHREAGAPGTDTWVTMGTPIATGGSSDDETQAIIRVTVSRVRQDTPSGGVNENRGGVIMQTWKMSAGTWALSTDHLTSGDADEDTGADLVVRLADDGAQGLIFEYWDEANGSPSETYARAVGHVDTLPGHVPV
jgi:hypothetical protein